VCGSAGGLVQSVQTAHVILGQWSGVLFLFGCSVICLALLLLNQSCWRLQSLLYHRSGVLCVMIIDHMVDKPLILRHRTEVYYGIHSLKPEM
jgi:hypothetical protein